MLAHVKLRAWTPVLLCAALLGGGARADAGCPEGMANIDGRFCIDRFEAALLRVDDAGGDAGLHSPFELLADGVTVRAVSRAGRFPQAHISASQAEQACRNANKRLCQKDEWLSACRGRQPTRYPYGEKHRPGYCNDDGVSPIGILRGAHSSPLDYRLMNDKRLNQVPGTLARSGLYSRCRNEYGVHDMVGNLHEWTAEKRGVFRGGFYLDAASLGDGCSYGTDGHDRDYRDYSTGFRCCRDL